MVLNSHRQLSATPSSTRLIRTRNILTIAEKHNMYDCWPHSIVCYASDTELEPSKVPGMGSGLSGGSPVKYKPPNPLPEKKKRFEFDMIN